MFILALALTGLFRPMDGMDSGAGGAAGTVTPPAAPPVSTPVSTPGTGSTPAPTPNANPDASGQTPAADPNANDPAYGNWKALRDQRDAVQSQYTQAQAQLQRWQAVTTEASTLATKLGYSAEDFQQAFEADPVKTLQFLRDKAETAPSAQQDPSTIQDLIRQEMAPINNVVNQQITEAAMVKFNTALDTSVTADPILKDAPPQVQSLVKDYVSEYLATQPDIVNAMKFKGDYSSVKDATTYVAGRLHGAFTEWLTAKNGATGATTPANTTIAPTGKRPTLDQIINDPSVLGDQYK